jgi:hypothetical protein
MSPKKVEVSRCNGHHQLRRQPRLAAKGTSLIQIKALAIQERI